MRAISLSLKAFGPYWEEQKVDFTELGEESIFLITGPTGAGKTTIFDAICYALYGKASGSDRDQDSLRSHFAEIEDHTYVQFHFALNQKEYMVIRSPKQYKKKERGEGYTDNPPTATLYELNNGEKQLLYSRIKEVNETIEGKLGFDYEQFRKMILIPQGEFRKLISENSKEREAVLQNIFHTYFYERMTDQLKTEARSLKEQIAFIEQTIQHDSNKIEWKHIQIEEIDSIPTILEKLDIEIAETKKQEAVQQTEKDKQYQEVQNMQQKLQNGKALKEKFILKEKLEREQKELIHKEDTIKNTKKRLQASINAAKVIPFEEQMKIRKKEWEDEAELLNGKQKLVNKIKQDYIRVENSYNEQLQQEDARNEYKESINNEKQQLEHLKLYTKLSREITTISNNLEKINKQKHEQQLKMQKIDYEVEAADNDLKDFHDITRDYYTIKDKNENSKFIIKKLNTLTKEFQELQRLRENYKSNEKNYQLKQEEFAKLKEKHRELEAAQKEQYAVLLAAQLDEHTPCPVCGSLEHPSKPLTYQKTINSDEIDHSLEKLQNLEVALEKQQTIYYSSKSEGQSQRLLVDKLIAEIEEQILDFSTTNLKILVEEWNQKSQHYQGEQTKLYKRIEELTNVKNRNEALKEEREKVKQTFDQFSENYDKIKGKLLKYKYKADELKNNIPEHLPDEKTFERKIMGKEKEYTQWIQIWEQIKKDYQELRESLQKEQTILDEKQKATEKAKENYNKQNKQFEDQVRTNGFDTIETYHQSVSSEEKQQRMENAIQTYEKRGEELSYQLSTLTTEINDKPEPEIELLENELKLSQNKFDQINELLQVMRIKMKNDSQIKQSIAKNLDRKQQYETDYYTVGELAELANGNNSLKLSFERYVLASFLDEILLQANLRLDRMTDHRYQLIRSGEVAKRGAQSGLDLEVLDHHTGQQRSVKTLSGGEGFKASLSLALGLADVVQSHAGGIQLDTLFIDEGFGTLDDDSLQQAIDCLKDLQQSNRLLGIISHVPHLKNEIHAKLQITPSHSGSKFAFHFGKV